MPIYTRGGDEGETDLFDGGRVSKDHLRIEALGALDEVNSQLGVASAALDDQDLAAQLAQIQRDLFTLSARLAQRGNPEDARVSLPELDDDAVQRLEGWIDAFDLPPLRRFILPGGEPAAAHLHVARAVTRRAERRCVALNARERTDPHLLPYLNRLSDYLFTAARAVNHRHGLQEEPWNP